MNEREREVRAAEEEYGTAAEGVRASEAAEGYERRNVPRRFDSDTDGKSPEELEAEIHRIRRDLDATLTAIERKFSPTQVIDKTLHYLAGGPTDYASNLSRAVKANPIPAALMGISLGWLMMSSEQTPRSAQGSSAALKESLEEARDRAAGATGRVKEKMSEISHSVSDTIHRAGEKMHTLGEKAHRTREDLGQKGHHYGEKIQHQRERYGEKMQHGRERLEEFGHRSEEGYRQVRGGFSQTLNEQPLLLGVLGIAAGVLAGAMIPPTRQEEQWMGEAGGRLREKVEETGREQMEKARRIVTAGAESAREEAERQLH